MIAAVDLSRERAESAAAQLIRDGHRAAAFEADVSDPIHTKKMVAGTVEAFGRLDILVNNAGIGHVKPFLEISIDEWQNVLNTNPTGTFLCSQAAALGMVRQDSGTIINIASISAERGGTGRAA
jgi:NAD(P)-dependent dehydrogenase (short-subunit alcohol dehydrogenase family)